MRIIAFLLVSLLIYSCSSTPEQQTEEIVKPIKYATIEVSYGGSFQNKTFTGTSQSGAETKLSFRANGLMIMQKMKVGDKVIKGQLLAELDKKDISLNYEKAKSALSSAKSQMETAQSNLERIKELYQLSSASLNEYEQAKNTFSAANSEYQTSQKSLSIQESQFEYAQIIAPTNGIISAVNADENEFVQAGSTIFMMDSREGDLEVSVGIPEQYISKIKHNDEVTVSINHIEVSGIVTEVGYSSAGLSTYPVTVKIISPNSELRPGMPAEVSFQLGSKTTATARLIIPVNAVSKDDNGHFVFVVLKDGSDEYKVEKKSIEIGELSSDGFEVVSGLKENDTIAVAGLRSLYEGMKVSLLN